MSEEFNEYVLFVDDEEEILNFYTFAAKELNLPFLTARDGIEAMKVLNSKPIFLIISDLKMPNLGGISFCKRLRETGNKTPFLLLTGNADKESAIEGLRVGVNDIIEKPTEGNFLKSLLKKYKENRIQEIEDERGGEEELIMMFVEEARELTSNLEEPILSMEIEPINLAEVNSLYRRIHTIKGSAASVELAKNLGKLSHAFENLLNEIKEHSLRPTKEMIDLMLEVVDSLHVQIACIEDNNKDLPSVDHLVEKLYLARDGKNTFSVAETTTVEPAETKSLDSDDRVLVSTEKLDRFMELAGELVAFKNIFQGFIRKKTYSDSNEKNQADQLEKMLTKLSDNIQGQIMEVRKVGLEKTFSKFPRVVRQIAAEKKKEIELEIVGKEIEVDKTIAKALSSCLIHAVRNACDHGIESPNERLEANKPIKGRVILSAQKSNGATQISIEDDGAGLAKAAIINKAIANNLISEEDSVRLNDEEVYDLIFLPGFSTASRVSNVSGRGIGMDVVKKSVQDVGGSIKLTSKPGQGTKLAIEIPVPKTVMVEQAVVAKSDGISLVVPLTSVADIGQMKNYQLNRVGNGWTTQFRGKTIPVATYDNFLNKENSLANSDQRELMVVVRHKNSFIGLSVDKISDQIQAVVRQFDSVIKKIEGFSGVTILSDNSVAFVLSAEAFSSIAHGKFRNHKVAS